MNWLGTPSAVVVGISPHANAWEARSCHAEKVNTTRAAAPEPLLCSLERYTTFENLSRESWAALFGHICSGSPARISADLCRSPHHLPLRGFYIERGGGGYLPTSFGRKSSVWVATLLGCWESKSHSGNNRNCSTEWLWCLSAVTQSLMISYPSHHKCYIFSLPCDDTTMLPPWGRIFDVDNAQILRAWAGDAWESRQGHKILAICGQEQLILPLHPLYACI